MFWWKISSLNQKKKSWICLYKKNNYILHVPVVNKNINDRESTRHPEEKKKLIENLICWLIFLKVSITGKKKLMTKALKTPIEIKKKLCSIDWEKKNTATYNLCFPKERIIRDYYITSTSQFRYLVHVPGVIA